MTENDVLLEKINNVLHRFDGLETKIDGVDQRLHKIEMVDAQGAALNQAKIEAAHRRMDIHDKQFDEQKDWNKIQDEFKSAIEKSITELKVRMGIIGFIGLAVLGSVVVLLFELLKNGHVP